MSNVYNHRPMVAAAPVSSRILELLDALRAECEKLSQDASAMKVHHDEYEQRLSSQASEMQAFQQSLHDLERTHQRIKAQYEEEIMRLRRELEARGGPQVPPGPFLPSAGSAHANGPQSYGMGPPPHVVNPAHPHSGSATASSSVPGQNGANGAPTQQPGAVPPPHPDHPSYGGAVPPQSGPPPSSMYGSHTGMPTPRQHITTPQISSQPLASGKPGASRHDEPPPHPLGGATSQPPPAHSIPPQQHNPPIPPPPQVAGEPGPTGPSHAVQKSSVDAHLATTSFSSPAFANQVSLRVTQALEHDSVVCCVRFSNDGQMLATGCNRITKLWDVATGCQIATLCEESHGKSSDLYIRSVCFSPDGKYLATGAEDRQIRVWNITTKTIYKKLEGHEQDIYSLDFSPDGATIASGSGDRTVRLWDIHTGKTKQVLTIEDTGHKDAGVTSVSFSHDGKFIAAASLDKIIRVWDISNRNVQARLEGHKDSVYAVSFSPTNDHILSGSLDKTLRIWNIFDDNRHTFAPQCLATLEGHKDFVLSVAYSFDGRYFVTGSKDRTVRFWDAARPENHCTLVAHKNSVISVAMSPAKRGGNFFATGSGDCYAKIWTYDVHPHPR